MNGKTTNFDIAHWALVAWIIILVVSHMSLKNRITAMLSHQESQDRFTHALKENADARMKYCDQELKYLEMEINRLKWKTMDKTFLDAAPEPTHSITNAYTVTINIHGREYHIVNGVLLEAVP